MSSGADQSNRRGEDGDFSDEELEVLRTGLLEWYDRHRRDLPWRGVDDPYRTWVAEIMLQQTRVETVVDYYDEWMRRFPDVESVAEAEVDDVLELWEGLGYYRRARYLHRSAQRVVEEYGGALPESVDELEELTGIGPYTAGAIASIAFGQPTPVVDGNVSRVLSRLCTIEGDPNSTSNKKRYWELAGELVDAERPGDFNQAMMELGATVCTPQQPSCLLCPLREACAGFAEGNPEAYPDVASRPTQTPVDVATCVLVAGSEGDRFTYLVKRDADGLLGGLWEFPSVELDEDGSGDPLEAYLADELDVSVEAIDSTRIGELTHLFSHLRMNIEIRVGRLDEETVGMEGGIDDLEQRGRGWLPLGQLDTVAMSTAMRRVERQTLEQFESES